MAKKHFEQAAAIVRGMVVDHNNYTEAERRLVARRFAQLFATFAPRFDHQRFYAACGVPL